MTTLYICSTYFQILSILSIAIEKKEADAHILLTNSISSPEWISFLQKTNIFSGIHTLPEKDPCTKRRHYLFQKQKRQLLCTKHRIQGFLFPNIGKRLWASEITRNYGAKLDLGNVSQTFIASPEEKLWVLNNYINLLSKDCQTYAFDEGLGSYLESTLSKHNINAVYLFYPKLSESTTSKRQILALDRPEMKFIWSIAKEVFSPTKIKSDKIFFDQWLGMPWLHDRKKGWQYSIFIKQKDAILTTLSKTFKSFSYAPHPLQHTEATQHYINMGLTTLNQDKGIPLELRILTTDCSIENKTFITSYSSAVIMPLIAFSSIKQYNAILLYNLFEKSDEMHQFALNKELHRLLSKIEKEFSNNLSAPKTEADLYAFLEKKSNGRNH